MVNQIIINYLTVCGIVFNIMIVQNIGERLFDKYIKSYLELP